MNWYKIIHLTALLSTLGGMFAFVIGEQQIGRSLFAWSAGIAAGHAYVRLFHT